MQIRTRHGRVIDMPTPLEDARITAAAESDEDARPLSEAEWAVVRPRRGRRPATTTKTRITIRLDADTVKIYKHHAAAIGANYQSLMNQVLRQHADELDDKEPA